MRRTVLLVSGTALLIGLLTGPANATSAPGSCPTGFNGPATFEDILKLPPVQAALDAHVYDKAHAEAAFDLTNKNGDLAVCWMWTGSYKSMYAPLMADNNAAPKPPK